jgi:hypothetical protein
MSVPWTRLRGRREYYIETNDKTYKMVFVNLWGPGPTHPDYRSPEYLWFRNNDVNHKFRRDYKFYDAEEIDKIRENAKKAREQMEQRTVNMILKKLVNEEFQWT